MFRGSVKDTGCPLNSPVSPPLSLPCVTVCHHISAGLYTFCCTDRPVTHPVETSANIALQCGLEPADRVLFDRPFVCDFTRAFQMSNSIYLLKLFFSFFVVLFRSFHVSVWRQVHTLCHDFSTECDIAHSLSHSSICLSKSLSSSFLLLLPRLAVRSIFALEGSSYARCDQSS